MILSETKVGLQRHLDGLSNFAKDKDLTVNTKKSKIMIFNKSGRKSKEKFFVEGKELEIVQTYTYLGIDISASGSFTQAIKELSSKAKKAMIPLYKTVIQFQMPFSKSLRLFQTFIEPILLYNAENWSILTNKQIEKCKHTHNSLYDIGFNKSPMTSAQLKYFKFILGLTRQCPNMAVLGEVSETPLFLKAYTSMLKFWNRIRHMGNETLVNKAYQENVEMNSNWCQTIQILNASQNLNTKTFTSSEFPRIAKQNIKNNFTRYWKLRIDNHQIEKKLELYSKVKHKFQRDPYLNMPSFKNRQILAKFICSNHKLEIETGRHKNVPRPERICKVCDLKKVEDENHFLIVCPAYSDIRRYTLYQPLSLCNTAEEILEKIDTISTVKYLKQAFKHRENLLEKQKIRYCTTKISLTDMQISVRKLKDTDAPYKPRLPEPLQGTWRTENGHSFFKIRRQDPSYKIAKTSNDGMKLKLKLVRKTPRYTPYEGNDSNRLAHP